MEKFCQSCGLPLSVANRGSEHTGLPSNQFCNLCYKNGEFIEPNISFDEMLDRGIQGLRKSNKNFIVKSLLVWGYPYQLKKLARWK